MLDIHPRHFHSQEGCPQYTIPRLSPSSADAALSIYPTFWLLLSCLGLSSVVFEVSRLTCLLTVMQLWILHHLLCCFMCFDMHIPVPHIVPGIGGISQPYFSTECHKRQLNRGSFLFGFLVLCVALSYVSFLSSLLFCLLLYLSYIANYPVH